MDKDKVKTFADKVFADMAGAMTAGMGYVGTKTGLFRSMAGKGPMHVDGRCAGIGADATLRGRMAQRHDLRQIPRV